MIYFLRVIANQTKNYYQTGTRLLPNQKNTSKLKKVITKASLKNDNNLVYFPKICDGLILPNFYRISLY